MSSAEPLVASQARAFLRARWIDLLLVTWKVPDEALAEHLPRGLELDRWEQSALVSLVAFDFADTRVLGVPWPGFRHFPELNLRFYVRRGQQRGVCFIREYVRSHVLAAIARVLYNEPYRACPYRREGRDHILRVGGKTHRIAWSASGEPQIPASHTFEHFLKEHEVGFGRSRAGETIAYRVEHPLWRVWPEVTADLDFDPGILYGTAWAFLAEQPPCSTIAAEGSDVAVFGATTLR